MATIYSSYYQSSTYVRTRVRVEYTPGSTTARATLVANRENGSDMTYQDTFTFTFGGVAASSQNKSIVLGSAHGDVELATVVFPVSKSGGTYSGSSKAQFRSEFNFEGSVVIPAFGNTPIVATYAQWQDLVAKVKDRADEYFSDSDWSSMWS